MSEPGQAGAAGSPRQGSAAARAEKILTPDQRVRVFISSTLGELAAERGRPAGDRPAAPGSGVV